ncbi:cation-dependent mannose-6-phosphate receptor-like [Rhodnius prolixus]|uniref:Uncharacterized protein n=1 Tax=Rhodnius prolixus TaxID=13249 RepID=T1HFW3_RHOPR
MFSSAISISVIIALTSFLNVWVLGEKCVLHDPNNSKKVSLLQGISLLTGQKFVASWNNYTYAVSICSDASKGNHPNASVTRTKITSQSSVNSTVVLGRYNDTDIVGEENWRLLIYSGGDLVDEPGPCHGTTWKTLIMMTCDLKADELNVELLDPLDGGCFAMFHLKTSIICPLPGLSPWSVFIMLLLTGGVCYLVIGIAYRRLVAGAKGWEQIPNYNFWRDPCAWPKEYLMSQDSSRRSEHWNNSRPNASDSVDEPLLHP